MAGLGWPAIPKVAYIFGQLCIVPDELPALGDVLGGALVDGDALFDGVGLVSGGRAGRRRSRGVRDREGT